MELTLAHLNGVAMLPTRRVERYLEYVPPTQHDIVLELRSLIVSVAPGVTESLRRTGLSYYFKERGGPVSAGLCQIGLHADHVRLAVIHGAFLPDPCHLLNADGDRLYKRYVALHSYEQAPLEALRDLLRASAQFDPYTLQPRTHCSAMPPAAARGRLGPT